MLKIRRPLGRLIFNMGIAIPGKTVFLIETAPWSPATMVIDSVGLMASCPPLVRISTTCAISVSRYQLNMLTCFVFLHTVQHTNSLCAIFFSRNVNMYLQFLSFLHWHNTGCWNPFLCKTWTYLFYIVNIMGVDNLATQGARASVTMIFTMLNGINRVPA